MGLNVVEGHPHRRSKQPPVWYQHLFEHSVHSTIAWGNARVITRMLQCSMPSKLLNWPLPTTWPSKSAELRDDILCATWLWLKPIHPQMQPFPGAFDSIRPVLWIVRRHFPSHSHWSHRSYSQWILIYCQKTKSCIFKEMTTFSCGEAFPGSRAFLQNTGELTWSQLNHVFDCFRVFLALRLG